MRRAGISAIVSVTLVLAISISALTLALQGALPALDRIEDAGTIDNNIATLNQIDDVVQAVAQGGRYASRTVTLRFQNGEYAADRSDGTFYYEIETDAGVVSTHASKQIGNVLLSANADVTVEEDRVNGVPCYRMENNVISVCIRTVLPAFDPEAFPALVGFWRFDAGTGQWVNDSSAHGNDGMRGNTTGSDTRDFSWVSGVHGEAAAFDGSDDYVDIPDSDTLDVRDTFTVSAWFNPDADIDGTNDQVGLVSKRDAYGLWWQSEDDGALRFGTFGGRITSTRNTWTAGEWYHVVAVHDGSTSRIYVNGVLDNEDSNNDPVTDSNYSLRIGQDEWETVVDNDATYFDGEIDGVRVYDRALTAAEAAWLHQQRGNVNHVNTSEAVVELRHLGVNRTLDGDITTFINDSIDTRAGSGGTTVKATGNHLGQGSVTLNVSSGDGQYTLTYRLLSGSDFLLIQGRAPSVTTDLEYVLDTQSDPVYIDGSVRGPGMYTANDIDFGAAVSEGRGLMSGLVAGNGFEQVGYDDDTGGITYGVNITSSADAIFLLPFTTGDHNDVTNKERFIRNGVIGPDRFLSYPEPRFAGALSSERNVRAELRYDHIHLTGPRQRIGPGVYTLTLRNEGRANGGTNVSITVQ